MISGTWSLRQAADTAGVTRALARACAADGLVGSRDLDAADLVILRCQAMLRTCLFPGESNAANIAKGGPREREKQAAHRVHDALRGRVGVEASVIVYDDRAVLVADTGALITETLNAHTARTPHLVLPIGCWLAELTEGAALASA